MPWKSFKNRCLLYKKNQDENWHGHRNIREGEREKHLDMQAKHCKLKYLFMFYI